MHVLMLGWEFPPFITGGLGTACHGLTKALDQRGTRVTFVLPKATTGEAAEHVDLISPEGHGPDAGLPRRAEASAGGRVGRRGRGAPGTPGSLESPPGFEHTRFIPVEGEFSHPYAGGAPGAVGAWTAGGGSAVGPEGAFPGGAAPGMPGMPPGVALPTGTIDYGDDLLAQVERYARFCLDATDGMEFDVIHAHDWLTYPAGLWIARHSGKPLVIHVHSTEFDRSGEHVNQLVYDIERRGMHGALRVITVSALTKNMVVHRYGVPERQVEVVYNGVDLEAGYEVPPIRSQDKIVLYFGRITYQKGPEYFIRAAKRVLEYMDDVKFVVAGSGDQARHMIEMAAHLGIGHKVLFTGFLRGQFIKRVFALADLYVMPSISEPFGIAPLEAMGHDVPVLISKSSGVSEVLTHALKVDFWDIDDMADKIVAVLRHRPLGEMLRSHGRMEARRLTWDGAAERCERIYRDMIGDMARPAILTT
jgi:glycosyltransferase involved in cell wall biosynthesis